MKCLLFLGLLLRLTVAEAGEPKEVNGKIYLPHAPRTEPAYLFRRTAKESDGIKTVRNEYLSLKGELLAEEIYRYSGDRLQHYAYKQVQMNEGGDIKIDNKKILYEFTKEGKTERDDENEPENIMLPDLLYPFIERNWQMLVDKEETLHTRYLVLEKLDTYGFKFFADGDEPCGNEICKRIIMKPSSIFIAAFVNPVKILVEQKSPHRIREIGGRLPIRVPEVPDPKKRSDYAAIDAVLVLSN